MSLTIIDKTKPRAPKFERKPHPDSFKTTAEEDRYWDKEFTKWIEGVKVTQDGERITGKHYFHMQEIMIPHQEGGMIYPSWRDIDDDIFESIEICEKENRDLLIGKRRGVGLSSIFGGTLPLYYALTVQNTIVPLTSNNKTKVENLLGNIILPAYSNLHPYYKPEIASTRKDELYLAKKINRTVTVNGTKKKEIGVEGMMSKILPRQTHLDVTAFESIRAKYGFLDELFLHPHPHKVRASMRMCFGSGLIKKGWMAMGGSAGDEKAESLKIAQEMWSEAEGLVTLFIAGYRGDPHFSINGWSQEEAAKEFIYAELERLSKQNDLTAYRNFKHAMPLTVEDMFAIKTSSVFPPEIMEAINQQRTYLLTVKPKIHIGEIEENEQGKAFFKPNIDEGKTKILSEAMPKPEDVDVKNGVVFGTDPIPAIDAEKKGSDFAYVAYNRATKQPILIRSERVVDVEKLTREKLIPAQKYFHGAQNMIERNRGDVPLQVYRNDGYHAKLLADEPQQAENKYADKKKKKGFTASPSMNLRRINLLKQYLINHCDKIPFIDLLDSFLLFAAGDNADLTDAFTAALLADSDWTKKEEKEVAKPKTYKIPVLKRVDGKMRLVYEEKRWKV